MNYIIYLRYIYIYTYTHINIQLDTHAHIHTCASTSCGVHTYQFVNTYTHNILNLMLYTKFTLLI